MDELTRAERALERNLAWVRAADRKVAPIFAVDAGLLGVLGVKLPFLDQLGPWMLLAWFAAVLAVLASLINLGLVVFPRLGGPKDSLVFFGTIVHRDEAAYLERLFSMQANELACDLARQAYRNAEIAAAKYEHLRRATALLFVALPLWVAALVMTRFVQ